MVFQGFNERSLKMKTYFFLSLNLSPLNRVTLYLKIRVQPVLKK